MKIINDDELSRLSGYVEAIKNTEREASKPQSVVLVYEDGFKLGTDTLCCVFGNETLADKYIEARLVAEGKIFFKVPFAVHTTEEHLKLVLHTHKEK